MSDAATVSLATHAMGCRVELLLAGESATFLRAAGEEALTLVEETHARLTRFEPGSVVWRLNAARAQRVDAELFALFQVCAEVRAASGGIFDVAMGGDLLLDRASSTVRLNGGAMDLGAIGKGFAIDLALDALRAAGVRSAFMHAGQSTAGGLGRRPDGAPWRVRVGGGAGREPITVDLTDRALGVSGDGEQGRHLVDPRRGAPAAEGAFGACLGASATLCDAWSTVLAILGRRPMAMPEELSSIVPAEDEWRVQPAGRRALEEAESCQS